MEGVKCVLVYQHQPTESNLEPLEFPYSYMRGWQCPVCNLVLAPHVSRCPDCTKLRKNEPQTEDCPYCLYAGNVVRRMCNLCFNKKIQPTGR